MSGVVEKSSHDFVAAEIAAAIDILSTISSDGTCTATIAAIADALTVALKRGNKILLAGNGGSAADAQHLAAEFVGRLNMDRPGLHAIALTTDTSVLTALANDYGYEEVFARQLAAVGAPGDVFVAFSTSGRSANIMRALEQARAENLATVGFTGRSGGGVAGLCDHCLCVPATETQKIQEAHIVLGHIVCGLVERALFDEGS